MIEFSGRIGHLDGLETPWGNAGGVVKTVEDVERMARTGVGWIEAGSYTLEKRYGNKRDAKTGELIIDPNTGEPIVDYYHDPETGETYNSIGMNNPGESIFVDEMPEMVRVAEANHKKLIANIAPVSDEPVAETIELVRRAFEAKAHAVLVNGGCPNVIIEGEARHEILSRDAEMTYLVLAGLSNVVQKYSKVFYRLSPQPSFDQARAVYQSIIRAGTVSAAWKPNTWPGHKPMKDDKPVLTIEGNIGGLRASYGRPSCRASDLGSRSSARFRN